MADTKIKVADLREYKTGSGGRYVVGKWGGARVVLVPDDEAQLTGREVGRWSMYLEEGAASPDSPDRLQTKPKESREERNARLQKWL